MITSAACGSVHSGPDASPPVDTVDAMLTWSPFERVPLDFDQLVHTPSVSSDGLTLYFTTQTFEIYFATRATRDAGFGAPAPLPNVITPGNQQRYLELSHDDLELYFTQDIGPILVATRPTATAPWGAPQPVGVSGTFPTISADKRTLYYIAPTGTAAAGEVRRITRAAPGQPWSVPSVIPLPVPINVYSSIDISRDGLSLLIAPPCCGDTKADLLFGTRRATTDPFQTFTVILQFVNASAFGSTRWNADETEIWTALIVDNVHRLHVSRLR